MIGKLKLFILLSILSSNSFSQQVEILTDESTPLVNSNSLEFGFGRMHFGVAYNYHTDINLEYTLQAMISSEASIGFWDTPENKPTQELKALFAKVGYNYKRDNGYLGVNAGIGFGDGVFRDEYISTVDPIERGHDCWDCTPTSHYSSDEFNGFVWVTGFKLGWTNDKIGIGIHPQWSFHEFNYYLNLPLVLTVYFGNSSR